jgi:hypothetical protein
LGAAVGASERGLAGWAQSEEFESVLADGVPGPTLDLTDDGAQSGVVDVVRPAAAGAHDVVVMRRLAGDVGMLARGQVDALDEVELGKQVEGAEDGRPADGQALDPGCSHEIGCREVAIPIGDQPGHGAARLGHPMRAAIQGDQQGLHLHHVRTIAGNGALVETQYQKALAPLTSAPRVHAA